jgi:hypothetical protein
MTISLHTLPQELQTIICNGLQFKDKVALSDVSKQMQSLVYSSLLSEHGIGHSLEDARITYITYLKGYCSYFAQRVGKVHQLIQDPELKKNVIKAKQAIDLSLSSDLKHSLTLPEFKLICLLKTRYRDDMPIDFLYKAHCSDFTSELRETNQIVGTFKAIHYLLEAVRGCNKKSALFYHVLRLLIEHKDITLELADFICSAMDTIPQEIIVIAVQNKISEEIIKRLKRNVH